MSAIAPNSHFVCRDLPQVSDHLQRQILSNGYCSLRLKSSGYGLEHRKSSIDCRLLKRREIRVRALSSDLSRPSAVKRESIDDCDQLDLVLEQARQRKQPIIIDWMANWCRKCIYLKPKLEKLAAEYDTKLSFSNSLFLARLKGLKLIEGNEQQDTESKQTWNSCLNVHGIALRCTFN